MSGPSAQEHAYRRYMLMILLLIYTFNSVDRIALGVVLQNVKADLQLSDTALGFLTGIAFTLFYAVMGIPIARWADRGNRVAIIALTTTAWSVMVSLCGTALTFLQLLACRVGVAVGEAGCVPPAQSLIADYFNRQERPRAVAQYMLGVPLALTLGFFSAGWINQWLGWRATFFILGLPGLLLGAIAYFTLREPRKDRVVAAVQAARSSASEDRLRDVLNLVWRTPSFRHLLVCYSVWYFFGYGILQWQPTFFIRSHHLGTGEIGTLFALIYGIGGGLGTYLGGVWAARYAAGNERLQLRLCAWAFCTYALLYVGAFLSTSSALAIAALMMGNLGGSLVFAPILATIQTLTPPAMRARSIALIYLFANLIGMGLGPLGAGALSDALRPQLGDESLRYALVALAPGYYWAAWHLWRASRTVMSDLARVEQEAGEVSEASMRAHPAPSTG